MSIRTKLIISFLAIVISTTAMASLLFISARKSIEKLRVGEMESIVNLKKERIETFFNAKRTDIQSFQGFFMVKTHLPVVTRFIDNRTNPQYIASKKVLDSRLKPFLTVYDYDSLLIFGPDGRLVYAVDGPDADRLLDMPLPTEYKMAFEHGKKGIWFSDVFADTSEENRYNMIEVAPLTDYDNRFIGVVAFRIHIDSVHKVIEDTTGLGETGETLIGKKIGNEVVFLNRLRHDQNTVLTRKSRMGSASSIPIQLAAQGKSGSGISVDYRGHQVVAAWRNITSLGWGVVAKIDTEETFAPVYSLERLSVILAFIVLISGAVAAYFFSGTITRPILDLQKGAEIIGSGNLDYRVGTTAGDEIGRLSRAFDNMTQSLKLVTTSRDVLVDSENRLRSIIDNIPDMAWLKDTDGRYAAVNEAFCMMCGKAPSEIIGRSDADIWPPELAERLERKHQEVIAFGGQMRFEGEVLNKTMDTIKAPIFNDKGELLGTVGISRDISERIELERKKTDFYAMLTHDIKSPLTAIIGYSELIMEDDSLDERTMEMIDSIHSSGERLDVMIKDFLALSKIESGNMAIDRCSNNLTEIVREAARDININLEKKGITYREEFEEGLPHLNIDRKLVGRAVSNLLQNAVRYSKQGGSITVAVRLAVAAEIRYLVILVSDTGPGISPDEQDKVFEKYYRSPLTEGIKGTGLGLAIVKAVAEAHGGRVELESALGEGCTFKIYLPIVC